LAADYRLRLEPVPTDCLKDAKQQWIAQSLRGRELKLATEVETWERKARQALRAYDDFGREFKIAN
jgi:hypothetical protein